MAAITLTVNGTIRGLEVEPDCLLVTLLRERLRLTGTHVGCDTSQCGVCTVLMDGRSVKACTVLAVQADGRHITTIEGLAAADGTLHPMQLAFTRNHALQCGFCTPGMVLAAIDLLRLIPDPTEAEVREGLRGVFCRCTGYHNIVLAVLEAARTGGGARPDAPNSASAALGLQVQESVPITTDAPVPSASWSWE